MEVEMQVEMQVNWGAASPPNDVSVIMSISNYGYWNVQKRPQPSKKPSENVQKPPKMPKMFKKMKNPQNRPKCQKRQILSWVSSQRPNFFLGPLTAP